MNKIQKIGIQISDNQKRNLGDKLVVSSNDNAKPQGRVLIHSRVPGEEKATLLEDTDNLIVYRGRNWLMQKALNVDLSSRPNWVDKYICWFAIGVDGAAEGNPLVPLDPELTDYGLGGDGGGHGLIGSGVRYVTVNSKDYHQFDIGYPYFLHDPDIPEGASFPVDCMEEDPVDSIDYECDRFLIAQSRTTIASTEANGDGVSGGCGIYTSGPLVGENYQDINEAALFVAPSNSISYDFDSDDIQIFARVCFSTIRKDSSRELIFTWLVYF